MPVNYILNVILLSILLIGVKCVEMDMVLNKIRVLGYVDQGVVVKSIQKSGRKAVVLSSSCSSIRSSWQLQEGQSPRLPSCYRCIIPRFLYATSKRTTACDSTISKIAKI